MTHNNVRVVSLRYRLLAAIGIPVLGMILIDPRGAFSLSAIKLIYYYPMGLSMVSEGWRFLGFAGYILLGSLVLGVFVVAKRIPFYVMCGLLAITCSLTSYGCHNLSRSLERTWGHPDMDSLHKTTPSNEYALEVPLSSSVVTKARSEVNAEQDAPSNGGQRPSLNSCFLSRRG